MARTVFCGKPFSVLQTLWLYCANGFSAVSASARRCPANVSAAHTTATPPMKVMNLTDGVLIGLSLTWERGQHCPPAWRATGAACTAPSFSSIHSRPARCRRAQRLDLQLGRGGAIIATPNFSAFYQRYGGLMNHVTRREFSGILLGAMGTMVLRPFDKVKPSLVNGIEIGV